MANPATSALHASHGERSAATGGLPGSDDPLLGCLLLLNRALQRPVPSAVLLGALPLRGTSLTLPMLGAAAAHAGLSAQPVDCDLDDIDDTMLPAILMLHVDRPCVLLRRCEYGRLIVALPGWGGGVQEVSRDELLAQYSGHAVLVQPALQPEASAEAEFPQHVSPSGAVLRPSWFRGCEQLLASTLRVLRQAGSRLKMWPALVAEPASSREQV
jgi:ATP-binding cassette subfamily C protein LapB